MFCVTLEGGGFGCDSCRCVPHLVVVVVDGGVVGDCCDRRNKDGVHVVIRGRVG